MDHAHICMSCMKDMEGFDVCKYCGWIEGTPPEEPGHLYPRTILAGRYMVGKCIGFGGFGITYAAWDMNLEVRVAIKEFFPAGLVNRIPGEAQVRVYSGNRRDQYRLGLYRFLAEARNMAKFGTHPHIVNVTNFFEENSTAYIVMEYLDGQTLKQYIKERGGRLSLEESMKILRPVSKALSAVHKEGIVHRDVSPDNIFLTRDGRVKLIDFGAARLSVGEKEETLSVILKPGYAPPEQYRTKSRQGPFTDVYALGATFYRMITGKVPTESIDRALEDDLKMPSELVSGIPTEVDRAVMRAMALDSDIRFRSTSDFVTALEGKTMVLFPAAEIKRRRRVRTLVLLAAAVIAIAAGAVLYVVNTRILPTTLTVWVPVYEANGNPGSTVDRQNSAMETLFGVDSADSIVAAFEKSYPQVEFDMQWIPESEYEARLEEAKSTGDMPDIFAVSGDIAGLKKYTVDVSELYRTSYLFADDYSACFPYGECLPTGFVADVVYANSLRVPDGDMSARMTVNEFYKRFSNAVVPGEYEAAFTAATGEAVRAGHTGSMEDVRRLLPDIEIYETMENNGTYERVLKESFPDGGQLTGYIGPCTDITYVQEYMPAHYSVYPLPGDGEYQVTFTGLWCVGDNNDANREKAAMLFISGLLGDSAQQILNIQGSLAMPVNEVALNEYVTSYFIEFGFIKEMTGDMTAAGVR